MAKVLILGLSGFVGYRLARQLESEHEISGTYRTALPENLPYRMHVLQSEDRTDLQDVIKESSPDVIINCIGMSNVDACEKEPEKARRINFEFVCDLVQILVEDFPTTELIQLSSNAVYDGEHAPYKETDAALPVNVYGRTKLAADEYVLNNLKNAAVVRPITMYGAETDFQRPNPLSWMIAKLRAGEHLRLVDDVYVNPLSVDDLALLVERVIGQRFTGLVNVSGNDVVNRYEWGLLVARTMQVNSDLLHACQSTDFPSLAQRPRNTSFDNRRMRVELGVEPRTLKKGILDYLNCQDWFSSARS